MQRINLNPRKYKFGNIPQDPTMLTDGYSFSSKGEMECYQLLKLLERAGNIKITAVQTQTQITPEITHRTDFLVFDLRLGEPVWVEYKGFQTERWRIIKKLWKSHGPGLLRIYSGYGLKMHCEEIRPKCGNAKL